VIDLDVVHADQKVVVAIAVRVPHRHGAVEALSRLARRS
jgi:hypothetical protein